MSEDARIAESVRLNGWHAIAVEGTEDEPSFLYTIGLCQTFDHPEIVIVDLDARMAHAIAAGAVARIRVGAVYRPGERHADLLEGFAMAWRPVHATRHLVLLGYAVAFYRIASAPPDRLRAVQLFWPDRAGKFPFEGDCDPRVAQRQPRLELAMLPSEVRAFRRRIQVRALAAT